MRSASAAGGGDEQSAGTGSERGNLRQLRHELRTPLNHILSYAELLREEAQDLGLADFVDALEDVRIAGKHTLTLINDLLNPARLEPQLPLELRDSVDAWLKGIVMRVTLLQGEARTRGQADLVPSLQRIETAAGSLLSLVDDAFPRTPVEPAAAEHTGRGPTLEAGGPLGQGSLLVVDDSEPNREVLARTLGRLGYRVISAENGRRALEILETTHIDLVLLDVMMPEMDGYQVLERRQTERRLRGIPFIMISALDDLDSIVRCIEMGAEDYLTKPFEPILLRARIGACLEKKRLRDTEVEYLRQVEQVIEAASAVEAGRYEPGSLGAIAEKSDELGRLARVFDAMATTIRAREERLRRQVNDLRLEIDRARHQEPGTPAPVSVNRVPPSHARVQAAAANKLGAGLLPGDRFAGRYEILAVVGSGGTGTVYKALDRKLGEDIAIKVIHPTLLSGNSTFRERFRTEIRLARRISHQNVVRTHDLGESAGVAFVTMEYVEGITLRVLIATHGRVGVSATLAIAGQLARALEAAHEHGVIHRDIKPENLLLDRLGVLKVMDFGIARLVDRADALTKVGALIGTPAYMSPEQLLEEAVDVRSDLYGTGVVLYECLTGRLPLEASSPISMIAKQLHEEPRPPSALNSELPPALSALVMRLLAKKADDRPRSAAELGDLLSQIT